MAKVWKSLKETSVLEKVVLEPSFLMFLLDK